MITIKHYGREIEVDFSPYQNLYRPYYFRNRPWWNIESHGQWIRSDGLRFTKGTITTEQLLTVEQRDKLRENYFTISAQYGPNYSFPKRLVAWQALEFPNYIGRVDLEAPNFTLDKMFEILDRAIPVPRPLLMPGQVWLTRSNTLELVTQTTVSGKLVHIHSDEPCYERRSEIHRDLEDAIALVYGPSPYGMNIPWVSMETW